MPTRPTTDFPQHSLVKSLGLHVLPGVLTTAAFLAFKPLLDASGYPPLLAFFAGGPAGRPADLAGGDAI